jgi:hypothetical protein
MRFASLVILGFFLAGCTSTQVIDDLNRSLSELQSITDRVLPGGRDKTSRNGREIYSKTFVQSASGDFELVRGQPTARVALIKILGDRRPYKVTIDVYKQKRDEDGNYYNSGSDESLARVLKRRFDKGLHQRREDRSIVDEFKAF